MDNLLEGQGCSLGKSMSNFIYCNIICKPANKDYVLLVRSSIVKYCINNGIGVHFERKNVDKCEFNRIKFQLSDDFDIYYCERFMEPIIYTLNGKPIIGRLSKDLDVLEELINMIFCYDLIDHIELRFSFVEVDEREYKEHITNINMMKSVILSEYLKSAQMPVIKVIIYKTKAYN